MSTVRSIISLLLIVAAPAAGQVVQLRGVINHYAIVTRVDSCEQRIEVESSQGFSSGDRVLLLQMKGGEIDQDTSGDRFGRLLDLGMVGVYHIGTVRSISGSVIELHEAVSRSFDVSGLVQLVRVPRYSQARVVDTVRPMSWNGRTGGVVALEVTDTLWLDAPIDASGTGFRGGRMVVQDKEDCSVTSRVQSIRSSLAGGRGETYAPFDTIIAHGGRARAAGAGGGGNSSNTGGGGGAGFGAGGAGGGQFSGCGTQMVSGEGGAALPASEIDARLFFGSGGGAGHSNNHEGTSGAAGGGIAIVRAVHVYGNRQVIASEGGSVRRRAGIDGAGGGGGGGTLIFDFDSLHSPVVLSVRGGEGGSGSGTNGCHGPGGGGGGGIAQIAGELASSIDVVVDGGASGLYTAANRGDCVDSPHGARVGSDGIAFANVTVIEGHVGGEFSLDPVSGFPGDTVMLSLWYDGALDSAFRPIRGVTTTIAFDPHLLSVADDPDRIGLDTLQMYRALTADRSMLASYPARLLLGPSGVGALRIVAVRPDVAEAPRYCQWNAVTTDALVTVGLCEVGDTRVVRVGAATLLKVIAPNPTHGSSTVSFSVAEDGQVSLTLIDALGVVRRSLFNGVLPAGEYSMPIDLLGIDAGRYVVRLVTANEAVTAALVVQR